MARDGIAYYGHSHPVHFLRRLTSLSQKIIQIFCLVLNTLAFNTSRSLISIPFPMKNQIAFQLLDFSIWLGTESNRRHKDFQSSALPTELPSLIFMFFTKTIFKSRPHIFSKNFIANTNIKTTTTPKVKDKTQIYKD